MSNDFEASVHNAQVILSMSQPTTLVLRKEIPYYVVCVHSAHNSFFAAMPFYKVPLFPTTCDNRQNIQIILLTIP